LAGAGSWQSNPEVEVRSLLWLVTTSLFYGRRNPHEVFKKEAAELLMTSPIAAIRDRAYFKAAQLLADRNKYIHRDQNETLRAAAIEMYETVVAEYSDVPYWRFGGWVRGCRCPYFVAKTY
jgi:hypothetical protein